MTRRIPWMPIAFFLGAAALFFVANRAAYKGYFSDDDLDNLGWPTFASSSSFYTGIATPEFSPINFRPVGFLYYRFMGRTFKLNYLPYVAGLQGLHILNSILLFVILRRLDFSNFAAGAGVVFYAFHAIVLEVYWKPMYIFDLLCGTLCLITLLLYIRGHWLAALPAFWLAYKSKEIVVMLPAGLLAYEWLLGGRRLKQLIPFVAISLMFGVQALLHNAGVSSKDVYALNFEPQSLWSATRFYASSILLLPFAGLVLLALPVFVPDRRLYLGLIVMASLLLPLILLSNRVADAYWYVPLIGLAIAVAAIASRVPRWAIALFFIIWLPLNYSVLRTKRRQILAQADEVRWYLSGLRDYAKRVPPLQAVVFEGTPVHMEPWGIKGAIKLAFGQQVDPVWYHDPGAAQAMTRVPMAIVSYYPVQHIVKGRLRSRDVLESAIDFRDNEPASQLGDGWSRDDGRDVRRTASKAEVTLYRPAGAKEFEIGCLGCGPQGSWQITVLEDGRSLGTETLNDSNHQPLRWRLLDGPPGNRRITIQTEPRQAHDKGFAIQFLGYAER